MLVYVTIDTPHVADQPHSTYASGVFSKIMGDILPYLNVFPSVDFDTQQSEAAAQLPEAEGITDNSGAAEETVAEPKVYETEEYIEPGADSDLPENVPESTTGESDSADESAAASTLPVQTVTQTQAASESTEATEAAKTEQNQDAAESAANESQSERETMSETSAQG